MLICGMCSVWCEYSQDAEWSACSRSASYGRCYEEAPRRPQLPSGTDYQQASRSCKSSFRSFTLDVEADWHGLGLRFLELWYGRYGISGHARCHILPQNLRCSSGYVECSCVVVLTLLPKSPFSQEGVASPRIHFNLPLHRPQPLLHGFTGVRTSDR